MIRKVCGVNYLFLDNEYRDMEHPIELNDTSCFIYEETIKQKTPEEIAEKLSAQFGIPQNDAQMDVDYCLQELKTQHVFDK